MYVATFASTERGRGSLGPWVLACACIFLAVGVLFAPLLRSRGASKLGSDWEAIHQVDAIVVDAALREDGSIPFWNPASQSGVEMFSIPTKAITYPPFLALVSWFGPIWGLSLLAALHAALGGLGMILLARRLGAGALGSGVAGVLFAVGAVPGALFHAAPYFGCAIAWWPFAMRSGIELVDNAPRMRHAVLLGAILGIMVHAGGIFALYWLAVLAIGLGVVAIARREDARVRWNRLWALCIATLTFLVVALPRLVPAFVWVESSGRSSAVDRDDVFAGYLRMGSDGIDRPARALFELFDPSGSPGALTLVVLAAFGLVRAWRSRVVVGIALGALLCLVVASGTLHDQLVGVLPGYDKMRQPYRFGYPAAFALAAFAALGATAIYEVARRRGRSVGAAAAVVVVSAMVFDLRIDPLAAQRRLRADSTETQRSIARPSLAAAIDDPRIGRVQLDRPTEQGEYIANGLETSSGLVGGEGSAHAGYERVLPLDRSGLEVQAASGRILDLLNVRYLAAGSPTDDPNLIQRYEPTPTKSPTGVPSAEGFVARLAGTPLDIEYSGFIGGHHDDLVLGVVPWRDEATFVIGWTRCADGSFAQGAQGAIAGRSDVFTGLVGASGATFSHSRVFGDAGADQPLDVAPNGDNAIVVGRSRDARQADGRVWIVTPGEVSCSDEPRAVGIATPTFVESDDSKSHAQEFVARGEGCALTCKPTGLAFEFGNDVPQGDQLARTGFPTRIELAFPARTRVRLHAESQTEALVYVLRGNAAPIRRPVHRGVRYAQAWPGVDLVVTGTPAGIDLTFEAVSPAALQSAALDVIADELFVRADRVECRSNGRSVVLAAAPVHTPANGTTTDAHQAPRFAVERTSLIWRVNDAPNAPLRGVVHVPFRGGLLCGLGDESAKSVAVLQNGDWTIAGSTSSWSPAVAKAASGDSTLRDADGFVLRVAPDGAVRWMTVFGGDAPDFVQNVALDALGRAYVTGSTRSSSASFPVHVGPQLKFGGEEDAFVACLAEDGASFQYCGYIGGAVGDYGQGVAVTRDGSLLVTGDTKSNEKSFPIRLGPDLTFNGGADAFVAKVLPDGSAFAWCGYVGGAGLDVPYDLAITRDERAIVTGTTSSDAKTFVLPDGPLAQASGGFDSFVFEVAADGSSITRGAFVGGEGSDQSFRVTLDAAERILIGGTTLSSRSFPTKVGPRDDYLVDPYPAYLAAFPNAGFKRAFQRPYLYERSTCLSRASVFDRPLLVVGDARARRGFVEASVSKSAFDPHAHVILERDSLEGDVDVGQAVGVVLCGAGAADDRPRVRTQAAARDLRAVDDNDLVWTSAPKGAAIPDAGLRPLADDVIRRGTDRMTIDVTGVTERYLLLAETFALHGGWSAFVDGVQTPVLQADALISAIELRPGARTVELRYVPPGLANGIRGSAVAFVLLVIGLAVSRLSGWRP